MGNRTARLGSRSLFFRTQPGGLKIHRVPSRLVEDTNIPQFDWFCLVSQHKCGGGGFFFPPVSRGKVCESCRVKTTKKCQLMGRNTVPFFFLKRHFLHWLVRFESVRATLRGKGLEIRF